MPKITTGVPTSRTTNAPNEAPRRPDPFTPATPLTGWNSERTSSSAEARRAAATSVTTKPAELSDTERAQVVQKKATCPFIASAVNSKDLPVLNNADKPLASIDDVAKLGNTGPGSNLGEVLRLFAQGNHARLPGADGKMTTPVPLGTFSLDFPGSQGSHAGHSGILQGDPTKLNTGRLSQKDFDRLAAYAKDGVVRRSDIGRFIAENVAADPNAKAPGFRTGVALAKEAGKLLGELGTHLKNKAHGHADPQQERVVFERLTKVLGEDNLIGSAGEFGLLTTFLEHSPHTREVKGEPAYSLAELKMMFVDKQLPPGWENWTKTAHDWIANTTALTIAAEKAYLTR